MSLINKMLQDLDARGGGGASRAPELKPAPEVEHSRRPLMLAGAVLGAVGLIVGCWYGWRAWQAQPGAQPAAPVAAITSVPPQPQPQPPAPLVVPPEPAVASAPPAVTPTPTPAAPNKVAVRNAEPAPERPPRRPASPAVEHAPAAGTITRDLSPKQMAETSYRRALVMLQEGRVSNALADLDKALEIDPRNEAARQTYVSLLLENKRTDDAIRQLRLALGIDPRQPGLAMVLARLQLEKGDPALQTLLTTLPYAGNSADYHGFLAGVLQREQRHAEAAQHYRDALGLSPDNGVWWMGLGISLQAEQHLPEAREAYTRARAARGLTPELQTFIDRKLEQLGR